MTATAEIELVLEASPEQQDVISCRAKRIALFAGRRWGKTVGVIRNRIVSRCLENSGFKYLAAAPSYSQISFEFDAMKHHVILQDFIRKTWTMPVPMIEFQNDSVATFRSLDRPNLLRGWGGDEAWLDEIQDVEEEVYDGVVCPLVAERLGTVGVSGQFRGTENWTYRRLYLPGQDKTQERIRSYRFPTSSGYCFQTPEAKEELAFQKSQLPRAVWDQEFDCVPTANQRAVFRQDDLDAVKKGDAHAVPLDGCAYVAALDLGRIADPSSYVVIEWPTATVVEIGIRPLRERHETGARLMADVVHRFGDCLCLVDSTGGATGGAKPVDEHVQHYRQQIPTIREFFWTMSNKTAVVHNLSLWIEQKKLKIPAAHEALFKQLSTYEFEYKNARYDFHAMPGSHDDLVSALAMAVHAYSKNWVSLNQGAPLGAML